MNKTKIVGLLMVCMPAAYAIGTWLQPEAQGIDLLMTGFGLTIMALGIFLFARRE